MPRPKSVRNRRKRDKSRSGKRGAPRSIDVQAVREKLVQMAKTLHDAMMMSITCEGALCNQDGGEDRDIARILRDHSSGKVYGAIAETGVMLALLAGKGNLDPDGREVGEFFSFLERRRENCSLLPGSEP